MTSNINANYFRSFTFVILILVNVLITNAQKVNDRSYYNEVRTYVNPVLPGDHPDPTLLKIGNDFYHCGSSFHFTPHIQLWRIGNVIRCGIRKEIARRY